VIYFFSKDQRFVLCEIYPGRPHVLTLIDANGVEHTEQHHCASDLSKRWSELLSELTCDGWQGPFGRHV
jgi:hypothetical protein